MLADSERSELFLNQGGWSEEAYLALNTKRLVEFDNGAIEILPPATKTHQIVVLFLWQTLSAFVNVRGLFGLTLIAPYALRVPGGKFREPDILYMTAEQNAQAKEEYSDAVEFAIEVVSPNDLVRDYVTKRRDCAAAGIPEYWIVDRAKRAILVLRLENGAYVEHAEVSSGLLHASGRLQGFTVDVDALFALDQDG